MTVGQRAFSYRVAVLMLVIAVLSACATVDPWTDTRIESEVKARLVAEHDANLTRLGVVSRERTVYLSGMVESDQQKERPSPSRKVFPPSSGSSARSRSLATRAGAPSRLQSERYMECRVVWPRRRQTHREG